MKGPKGRTTGEALFDATVYEELMRAREPDGCVTRACRSTVVDEAFERGEQWGRELALIDDEWRWVGAQEEVRVLVGEVAKADVIE